MSVEEVKDVDDKAIAAWDNHNPSGLTDLLAESFTFTDPNMPEPMTFREQVQAYMTAWFTAFPDMHVNTLRRVVAESEVAAELEFTATNTGTLAFGDQEFPATGRSVKATGTYFATIEGGKIVSISVHPDVASLMNQLGLPAGA
ncbi:ester cyclase [Sinomonas sp. JGH33]|uniref:Ester cyclase n=1 Tax=Sinomonas terricola TaxID=3110330 RepID=A0ABU5TC76_9MICC|nr:ester cyclase [Sinomonas sp. JGH33]MEA5457046.1 ester cyclase [Sinomonas sp. JGH33]